MKSRCLFALRCSGGTSSLLAARPGASSVGLGDSACPRGQSVVLCVAYHRGRLHGRRIRRRVLRAGRRTERQQVASHLARRGPHPDLVSIESRRYRLPTTGAARKPVESHHITLQVDRQTNTLPFSISNSFSYIIMLLEVMELRIVLILTSMKIIFSIL